MIARLPQEFVDKYLPLADDLRYLDRPIVDLTKDELLAAFAQFYEEKKMADKYYKASIDFMRAMRHLSK